MPMARIPAAFGPPAFAVPGKLLQCSMVRLFPTLDRKCHERIHFEMMPFQPVQRNEIESTARCWRRITFYMSIELKKHFYASHDRPPGGFSATTTRSARPTQISEAFRQQHFNEIRR